MNKGKNKKYGGKCRAHWIEFRNLILEIKNRVTCEYCGEDLKYPVVHHCSYDNGFFDMNIKNYAVLCGKCHKNIRLREVSGLTARAFVHVPFNETLLYEGIRDGRCCKVSNSELRRSRRSQGLCEMSCASCRGVIIKCPDCGYNYCDYHFHSHLRRPYASSHKKLNSLQWRP